MKLLFFSSQEKKITLTQVMKTETPPRLKRTPPLEPDQVGDDGDDDDDYRS